ncbi:apoptosis inhibitor 5 isoform X4 [Ochotona curzoniae]|uniref:apoptosis inhibitor 5 isoform X4 n=1 Tax=Ochotona curzoniae TaxID=130825 RepID=UPI001B34879E|nr:apoptosis inhibitor 5 isoform X4 [Ochotona curzoniae]
MPTVEELYRNYGILADATEQVGQHKDAYQVILDGVKGGTKEKRLAAQFIPKFFKHFPELADSAINAQLDLCEDEDVSIRRQAIKELPQFATGENLPRVADILTQLLQTDDSAEFNLVNNALLSIFKMDKLETNLRKLFDKLLEYMPLPPEEAENGENAGNEEPKLQFSYVECLLYSFHQLGRKLPDFLTAKLNAEKLKDFKIRLQYFARGLQVYIRQLRLALQGKTGDALKTEENKIKVVALKITNNINVLIKDLFHIPPSYKSTVTLSWKPVQKVELGQKRATEDRTSGSPPKKSAAGPKRDARQIYNPPSGKYSSNLSNFNYERSLQGK